jgi:hypothetical protein
MKVREKATEHLRAILNQTEGGTFITNTRRNAWVAEKMRGRGWETVTVGNVVQVAASLGFPVIGECIYNLYD